MNKKLQSELDQKFQILDRTTNNKSKNIMIILLIFIATLTFLSSLNYDIKKNNGDSLNAKSHIQKKQKDRIIKAHRENSQEFLKTAKTALRKLERFNLSDWDPVKYQELNQLLKKDTKLEEVLMI